MTDGSVPDDPRPDRLSAIRPPITVDDRVTVRHRLNDGSATDVVGWLTEIGDRQVIVQSSRSGQQTAVPRERIIVAKRVPPAMGGPAPTRTAPAELERVAQQGWIADTETLGEWTLRSGGGFTSRANSCLAVGDPGTSIEAAAGVITKYYRTQNLPPLAQVIENSAEDRALSALGWHQARESATVLVIPLVSLLDDHPRDRSVTISEELSHEWWQVFQRYRPAPEEARRILAGTPPVGLAELSAGGTDGQVAAIGRGQVTQGWLGLSALWTEPESRRHGFATRLMRELGHWAARHGARNVYLQVSRNNAAAVTTYQRMGFTAHHDYRYLAPPD